MSHFKFAGTAEENKKSRTSSKLSIDVHWLKTTLLMDGSRCLVVIKYPIKAFILALFLRPDAW